MKRLIFATGNQGKMREIREILGDCIPEILSMKEAGIEADIVEDGKTFEENALIKARAVSKAGNIMAMADDSGLVVDCAGHLFRAFHGRGHLLCYQEQLYH